MGDVGVGEIQPKDVKRTAVMREKDTGDFAVIFAFDAPMGHAALEQAKRDGVQVVKSDIFSELEKRIDEFKETLVEKAKKKAEKDVVFPVIFRILRDFSKAPMVLGCEITAGQLRVGTPLCVAF